MSTTIEGPEVPDPRASRPTLVGHRRASAQRLTTWDESPARMSRSAVEMIRGGVIGALAAIPVTWLLAALTLLIMNRGLSSVPPSLLTASEGILGLSPGFRFSPWEAIGTIPGALLGAFMVCHRGKAGPGP